MTINQKLFRQGLLATASTVTVLAATTGGATAAQAAPTQRDGGPHGYKVFTQTDEAWALPPGLSSFTVYAWGAGGGGGGGAGGGGGGGGEGGKPNDAGSGGGGGASGAGGGGGAAGSFVTCNVSLDRWEPLTVYVGRGGKGGRGGSGGNGGPGGAGGGWDGSHGSYGREGATGQGDADEDAQAGSGISVRDGGPREWRSLAQTPGGQGGRSTG
ncbi:hypothetical protein ACFU6K_32435, partial [Kitasatospora sp. NPDC057512]